MAQNQRSIPGNEFFKSLGKLEALAKGTQEMDKSQLFHTKANSEQKTWSNGETTEFGNDWDDNIGSDGTDYAGSRQKIAEKVMKGQSLSPDELMILKRDLEKEKGKEDEKGGKEEDEDNKFQMKKAEKDSDKPATEEKDKSCDMAKSFQDTVVGNPTLSEALEMSDFLQEFAKAFGAGLGELEVRTERMIAKSMHEITNKLANYINDKFSAQSEFNKSLADVVVNIGHGVAGSREQQEIINQMPVGAPKSNFIPKNTQVLQKSFVGSGAGENFSKSQKADAMVDLVVKGQLDQYSVLKFDSTGEMSPDVEAKVIRHLTGGNAQ